MMQARARFILSSLQRSAEDHNYIQNWLIDIVLGEHQNPRGCGIAAQLHPTEDNPAAILPEILTTLSEPPLIFIINPASLSSPKDSSGEGEGVYKQV
ncbi:hypothetical protein BDV12DRAFT_163301, partial [Aspergillus spectabilis]